MDVDRKTVSKWLKSNEFPKYHARKPSPSKLEPFKGYIVKYVVKFPKING
jgi:transposase